METDQLIRILEGALLAAGKPMTVPQLADLFEEGERPDCSTKRRSVVTTPHDLRLPRRHQPATAAARFSFVGGQGRWRRW